MYKLKELSLRKIVLAICGKKGLNLSTEERHAIQQDVIGVASLGDMNTAQLDDLIFHLRKLQNQGKRAAATPTPASHNEWKFVFGLAKERQSYARKIFRLAQRIGAMQKPPVPVISKAYIEGITEQMRGTDHPLEFCDCDQLHKVIQALEVFLKRHGA